MPALKASSIAISNGEMLQDLAKVRFLVVQITAVAGTLPYEKIQQ